MNGKQLRAMREARGWSQRTLAEKLLMGVNGERQVRRWESGDTPVPGPVEVAVVFLAERI